MRADSDSSWGFFWAGLLGLLFLFRKAAGVATFAVLCLSNRDLACRKTCQIPNQQLIFPFAAVNQADRFARFIMPFMAWLTTVLLCFRANWLQGELASGRIGFRANWLQGELASGRYELFLCHVVGMIFHE
jgi:hypothetical protein